MSNHTLYSHLFIAAYDVETPESLLITIPEQKASLLLPTFNNDYEQMATSLTVVNKKLILINPKYH